RVFGHTKPPVSGRKGLVSAIELPCASHAIDPGRPTCRSRSWVHGVRDPNIQERRARGHSMEGPQVGELGEGQAGIRHAAVGVNCTDTYHIGIQTQKGTLYPTQPT